MKNNCTPIPPITNQECSEGMPQIKSAELSKKGFTLLYTNGDKQEMGFPIEVKGNTLIFSVGEDTSNTREITLTIQGSKTIEEDLLERGILKRTENQEP